MPTEKNWTIAEASERNTEAGKWKGADAVAGMPQGLRTFFEPQAEQLGVHLAEKPFGLAGVADSPNARGWLWVAALGDCCLLSAHAVVPRQPIRLEERPRDYGCIASVSEATARECTPSAVPHRLRRSGNVVAFAQPAGTTACDMVPDALYEARNICLLPGFFRAVAQRHGGRFDDMLERFGQVDPDLLPSELRAVLGAIGPECATSRQAGLLMEAKVDEAVFLLASHMDEQERALQDGGSREQRALALQARRILDADLRNPPTLDELARALYVSRARLCAAFKQEAGVPVGAYVRRRRMERARELLAGTDLPIARVAREVGYRNPGSFTEAFERETGMPPSAWRKKG